VTGTVSGNAYTEEPLQFSQLFDFNLCLKGRNKLLKLVKVSVVIEGNDVIYKEEDD